MRWLFKAVACICALTSGSQSLDACTAFQIKSKDGANIYCRSMEFGVDLQSNLLIAPRGSEYKGTAPDNQMGLQWQSKYGFVGLNQALSPTFVSDGMNEKGLVVGVLYLPGFAEYETPDPKRTNETLGAWELAAYLLGMCENLEDVKTSVENVLVAKQTIPGTDFSFPLHFYIGDKEGNVLIIEYVNGKRYIHEDPIGVLTNSPPFDWHMNNLSNFVNLSPINVQELKLKDDTIKLLGQGSGLLGLPGDYTPPSRFVRAALFSQWATPSETADETARLGFHILNTFDIFYGVIREKHTYQNQNAAAILHAQVAKKQGNQVKDSEYTQWTVVHDRTNLKTYFRGYDSLQIQMVDFNQLDFSQPGFKQIEVQHKFIVEDISKKAQPLPA